MDIRMPVLDGVEAVRQLRQNPALGNLKVIAVTASVLAHERQAIIAAGFDDFVAKPFRFEAVCQMLAVHLGVDFVAGDGAEEEEVAAVDDGWDGVAVPAALMERRQKAARTYSVTELEEAIGELEGLGPAETKLGAYLRVLRQRHDMQGVLAVLADAVAAAEGSQSVLGYFYLRGHSFHGFCTLSVGGRRFISCSSGAGRL